MNLFGVRKLIYFKRRNVCRSSAKRNIEKCRDMREQILGVASDDLLKRFINRAADHDLDRLYGRLQLVNIKKVKDRRVREKLNLSTNIIVVKRLLSLYISGLKPSNIVDVLSIRHCQIADLVQTRRRPSTSVSSGWAWSSRNNCWTVTTVKEISAPSEMGSFVDTELTKHWQTKKVFLNG